MKIKELIKSLNNLLKEGLSPEETIIVYTCGMDEAQHGLFNIQSVELSNSYVEKHGAFIKCHPIQ